MTIYGSGSRQKRSFFQPIRWGERSRVLLFRASNKSDLFFQPISFETKAIFFQLSECYTVLSFQSGTMPPAVVYLESDLEAFRQYHQPDDELPTGGESWDDELVDPGQMVYIGQGQAQFLRIGEVEPGLMWPKRRRKKKKKKKGTSPPPSPASPEPASPAPIDWGDWEELCQAAPPQSPPPPVWEFPYEELTSPVSTPWQPEDWDAELASQSEPPWEPEDWDAELASQAEDPWQPEDWEAELSQWEPEDWDAELASQWQPEDWEAELSQ